MQRFAALPARENPSISLRCRSLGLPTGLATLFVTTSRLSTVCPAFVAARRFFTVAFTDRAPPPGDVFGFALTFALALFDRFGLSTPAIKRISTPLDLPKNLRYTCIAAAMSRADSTGSGIRALTSLHNLCP